MADPYDDSDLAPPADPAPAAPAAPAADGDWGNDDPVAPSGKAYLDLLAKKDPGRAAMVRAIGDGRMALPRTTSIRGVVSPDTQALIADVSQYNPQFDNTDSPSRIAGRKAFTSGKQGQNITSFNTALDHLDTISQAVEGLGNHRVPLPIPGATQAVNWIGNAALSGEGSPRTTAFDAASGPVLDELVRAFRGVGGNEADIQRMEGALHRNDSPQQQRQAIQTWAKLLAGRIKEIQNSYNTTMGTTAETVPGIAPGALDKLNGFLSPDYVEKGIVAVPGAQRQPPATPGAPPSGPPPAAPPAAPPGSPGGTPSAPLDPDGTGDIGFNTRAQPKQLSPEDQAALASLAADPKTTPDDIAAFVSSHGLGSVANIDAIRDAYAHGRGLSQQSVVVPPEGVPFGGLHTGAAELANSASFGTLPKLDALLKATGGALRGAPGSFGDNYNRNLVQNNADLAASDEAHPVAALTGAVGGFMAGDAAIGAVPGVARLAAKTPEIIRPALGDALYGTAYGVGSSDSTGDILPNALTGGALSALGGATGRGVLKGASALISPVAQPAVQRLTAAGITLTPGQILGGGGPVGRMVKGTEDRLAGFPVIGDIINSARRGGVEDFNKAAIDDALAPIGQKLPDGIEAGHDAVAHAQRVVSDAYDKALAPMRVQADSQLMSDIQGVGQKVQKMAPDQVSAFTDIMDNDVQPYWPKSGVFTGENLQSIKQGLDKEIARRSAPGASPQDARLADRLGEVRDAVLDLAGRGDPANAADFAKANQAYSMLSRINNAASKAKDGVFTPNQFRQAVTKRGYGTTTANVARGSAPMQQLATDASTILPSSVPDSGTAGRAALGMAITRAVAGPTLGAGAGAGSGYLTDGAGGAVGGALVGGALFSRPGLRAAQKVLAGSRGKTLNTLGDVLRRNAALGGAVGTPLLLEDLTK